MCSVTTFMFTGTPDTRGTVRHTYIIKLWVSTNSFVQPRSQGSSCWLWAEEIHSSFGCHVLVRSKTEILVPINMIVKLLVLLFYCFIRLGDMIEFQDLVDLTRLMWTREHSNIQWKLQTLKLQIQECTIGSMRNIPKNKLPDTPQKNWIAMFLCWRHGSAAVSTVTSNLGSPCVYVGFLRVLVKWLAQGTFGTRTWASENQSANLLLSLYLPSRP